MAKTKCSRCEYADWYRYSGKECEECNGTFKNFKPATRPPAIECIYIGHRDE